MRRWDALTRVTLRWGPHIRHVALSPTDESISLSFHKIHADRVTLQVEVEPPATLTFGYGTAPDARCEAIDEGWERSQGWTFPRSSTGATPPPRTVVRASESAPDGSAEADDSVYHVRLTRRVVLIATEFNMSFAELESRFLRPWKADEPVHLKGRAWPPSQTHLTIYRGMRLTSRQRSLGLGWSKAIEFGENVTDEILRAANAPV